MAEAIFEKVLIGAGQSFGWREFRARFKMPWHFHPEYELTYIISGQGMRHVGDSIERFGPGELVLLGKDLPHYWWQGAGQPPGQATVLHFSEATPGANFWDLPECKQVRTMLTRSQRAMMFPVRGNSLEAVDLLRGMKDLHGWRRLRALIDILGLLSESIDYRLLASSGFSPALRVGDGVRMEAVCHYVNATFADSISQTRAAGLAGLSPSAFSRFFHRRAGKTFESYVNEVRVGHACRLLDERDASVTEVAFQVGFNNLSNFNRRFRQVTGLTPRDYRTLRTRDPME